MTTAVPVPPVSASRLRTFLAGTEGHDWRRSWDSLVGAEAADELVVWSINEMRAVGAISQTADLEVIVSAAAEMDTTEIGVECLSDALVVAQLGAAVRDLLDRRHQHFDCNSVPEGVFWRKNAARDWPRQALPERYGWLSDSASVRKLLEVLLADGSATRFCDAIGFTRTEGKAHNGYGPMFFMFFTSRQINRIAMLEGVEFFRPFWPDLCRRFRRSFERRAMDGSLAQHVPAVWSTEKAAWDVALNDFEASVLSLGEDEDALLRFLEFSITFCKPMWGPRVRPADPRWHPVAACRHLLDEWYGANHLFMGDGYTWSERRTKGHPEWLVSSFENFDIDRVPVFPDL